MARWGVDAIRFRLRGSTDEATEKLLGEIKEVFSGVSARQIARHGARGAGRRAAADLPGDARGGLRAPGRRAPDLHRLRGRRRARPAARPDPLHGRRHRHQLRDRRGRPVHRRARRRVHVRRGQGRGDAPLRRRARHRPRALLRVLRLGLRPADAARGREPGGRQPRRRADPDRRDRGLARDALRAPRPPAGARRAQPSRSSGAALLGRNRIGPWTARSSRTPAPRAKRS